MLCLMPPLFVLFLDCIQHLKLAIGVSRTHCLPTMRGNGRRNTVSACNSSRIPLDASRYLMSSFRSNKLAKPDLGECPSSCSNGKAVPDAARLGNALLRKELFGRQASSSGGVSRYFWVCKAEEQSLPLRQKRVITQLKGTPLRSVHSVLSVRSSRSAAGVWLDIYRRGSCSFWFRVRSYLVCTHQTP